MTMRNRIIILAILVGSATTLLARRDETIEQLMERAESARLEDRPAIYEEIAQREVDSAGQLYQAGKPEEARTVVGNVVTFSDKARDAAIRSGKRVKDTEIAMRKMAARLRDIRRTLAFEDQAPVDEAANRLEQMRTELLSHMFGKKGGK
jgi:hypothetical protein